VSGYDAGGLDRRSYDGAASPDGEGSLGDLFSMLTSELSQLVRSEMELARVELHEEATKAGKAAGMLVGGAVAALVALILLTSAVAWGLAEVVEPGWAFLVVGLVVGAVAAVLAMKGRTRLADVHPVPDLTVDTLKEDARWARAQVR
jgi:hypothetical protein